MMLHLPRAQYRHQLAYWPLRRSLCCTGTVPRYVPHQEINANEKEAPGDVLNSSIEKVLQAFLPGKPRQCWIYVSPFEIPVPPHFGAMIISSLNNAKSLFVAA
jgi:hypothetical protein